MENTKETVNEQLALFGDSRKAENGKTRFEKLDALLAGDLDFHGAAGNYASHNFHSFPARFPPQLPKLFIEALTRPGDTVLDPMSGSGTTVLEAWFAKRRAIGLDIDPLAVKLSKVKTALMDKNDLVRTGHRICQNAREDITSGGDALPAPTLERFDAKTGDFINYWFHPSVQPALAALRRQIERLTDRAVKNFFEIAFSSVIITKTGGVSLALDLGHTRPHRTKVLVDQDGEILFGDELFESLKKKNLIKTLRSPINEFKKRFQQNVNGLLQNPPSRIPPEIIYCDSQRLCLKDQAVDLIVTSPPYAANAIDYMRAHKFSLVWFGYSVEELTARRREYIGAESVRDYAFVPLPRRTSAKVEEISAIDPKRGKVLQRYYSEISKSLGEMYRVLKPDRAAIVVVGSSVMRGIDTETHLCLKEIGESVGFQVPRIGVRRLDRNRRMLPAGMKTNLKSQIEQRMHEEYIIGFYRNGESSR